jgi:glycosyltransferase involved in cell wall biosynthesis
MNIPASSHIIIASYYFPPLGLAGTARPLALANYLAEQGFAVSVVTVKDIDYPAYDETPLQSLHPRVRIFRAGSADPARISRIISLLPPLRKVKGLLRARLPQIIFPDSKVGFVKPATKLLTELLDDEHPNILITTSPPVSIHQVGMRIARRDNLTWIADFRDIWGSLPYQDQSIEYRARADAYLRAIASNADMITATSPATLDHFRSRVAQDGNYYFFPNGYDESDFVEPTRETNGCLGLYGTLNHLVGVEKLFAWIQGLGQCDLKQDIRVRHTGLLDLMNIDELLARYGLQGRFESVGYRPHLASIQEIRCNLANIIMLSDQCDTSYIIPSKLFELLRAEPPLIAILPKGNAARLLLEERGFADVFIVDDAEGFIDAIQQAVDRARMGRPSVRRPNVEEFERRNELDHFRAHLESLL